jgi:hypothetical protein
MRRTERVIDVQYLEATRLHRRAKRINESRAQPRPLRVASCILQATDQSELRRSQDSNSDLGKCHSAARGSITATAVTRQRKLFPWEVGDSLRQFP